MLELRLLGFEVQIHLSFLILGLFVLDSGLNAIGIGLWMLAALVSVLTHEMGHALTVRWAGGQVQRILLHGLGGVTLWNEADHKVSWSRRIGIAAAGAGLGFLVGGALFGVVKAGVLGRAAVQLIHTPFDVFLGDAAALGMWLVFFLGAFIWVTFVWGLVNWLPIGGLDGWHILSALLGRWSPRRGPMAAAVIGLIVAVVAGAFLFQRGYRFAPLVFIVFALQQFRGLRASP